MSEMSALGSPVPSGLFGLLRSWWQVRAGDAGPPSESPPSDLGWPGAPFSGTVRVLVVDDNPVNLMVISAMMEMRGLSPLLAADGAEAVALACELPFDLVLMDLQMPILDGLDATSAIRLFEATHGRPAVPVIAYSCNDPGAHVLARHGLNGSLPKPCSDQELEDCLVQWCPTYRTAPAAPDLACGPGGWQPASRAPEAGRASPG